MTTILTNVDFQQGATAGDLITLIERSLAANARSVLVLISAQSEVSITTIPAIAANSSVSISACVVPGLIYDNVYSFDAIMVVGFQQAISSILIPDISADHHRLSEQLQQFVNDNGTFGSAFMLVDGHSDSIESFITNVYECLGSDRSLIGGGGGSIPADARPCVANVQGCFSNAAIIFCISNGFQIKTVARHALPAVEGPFLVTRSEGNVLHSLNYQPAFEVLSTAVRRAHGITLTQDNIHCYPVGLKQLDNEYLVRDIVGIDNSSLRCIGRVAENSLIYILHAEKENMIAAASKAGQELLPKLQSTPLDNSRFVFLIDCITRALYLQDDFQREVNVISGSLPQSLRVAGVLSVGEINNSAQGTIQFLNKAIVLGGV